MQGELQGDPDTEAWLETAVPSRAALTSRQKYDAARIRIHPDVPGWLKEKLIGIADEWGTSLSQLSAFLLGWAVVHLLEEDTEIDELLASSAVPSRALRIETDLEMGRLEKRAKKTEK